MKVRYAGREAFFEPDSLMFGRTDIEENVLRARAPSELAATPSAATVEVAQSRDVLERLVLNVANLCNLDCVYCYAQGGDYGGPREKMTFATGRAALDRFLNLYQRIDTVQFFGGEPLLNWPVVRDLCEYGWQLADSLGKPRPVWMLSTNGTVLNDDIVRLIVDFDVKVTVSCDGPPDITDQLRPTRTGDRASRLLERNITRLLDEAGQPVQIEGTYTATHVRERCEVTDVLDYVKRDLGVLSLHMPANVLSAQGPHDRADPQGIEPMHLGFVAASYAKATADAVRVLATQPAGTKAILSGAVEIIEELVMPSPAETPVLCPAGTGTIAVDSDGSVYPCFMFYRRNEFRIGHVRSPATVKVEPQVAFVGRIGRATAPDHLRDSWARRFVAGCAGANFFQSGDHGQISAEHVQLTEAMVEAAVVELVHLDDLGADAQYLPLALRLHRACINAPMVA